MLPFNFLYKYVYFQKSCTNNNINANVNDIAVFTLIGSDLNRYVNMLNIIIPAVNEMNLPGQNIPSKPFTADSVAFMKIQVIGMPNNISNHLTSLAHDHNKGPFNCIHTSIWPNIKRKNANAICL